MWPLFCLKKFFSVLSDKNLEFVIHAEAANISGYKKIPRTTLNIFFWFPKKKNRSEDEKAFQEFYG
jgi:hypothetical protein